MTIVVFGSVNIDITTYGDRLPQPGESMLGARYVIGQGGKGANQAVAAARLGAATHFVGRTGTDILGGLARELLNAGGVSTANLMVDPSRPTGLAAISVDASAENAITFIAGANMGLDAGDAERVAPLLAGAEVLLLQLEVPLEASLAAAARVRAAGGVVILDPAPAPAGGLADAVLRQIDVLTPNEIETEALVGIRPTCPENAAEAAARLAGRGLAIGIVKMGARGVYFRGRGAEGFVPVYPVKAVDTVAAGDCFNGGLAFALLRGDGLEAAVRFAAACGALATTRPGASASAPTLAEVEALMQSSVASL
jgi:ribokinase